MTTENTPHVDTLKDRIREGVNATLASKTVSQSVRAIVTNVQARIENSPVTKK